MLGPGLGAGQGRGTKAGQGMGMGMGLGARAGTGMGMGMGQRLRAGQETSRWTPLFGPTFPPFGAAVEAVVGAGGAPWGHSVLVKGPWEGLRSCDSSSCATTMQRFLSAPPAPPTLQPPPLLHPAPLLPPALLLPPTLPCPSLPLLVLLPPDLLPTLPLHSSKLVLLLLPLLQWKGMALGRQPTGSVHLKRRPCRCVCFARVHTVLGQKEAFLCRCVCSC